MDKKIFSKRLKKANKNLLKSILFEAGLRNRVYEILYKHYIEEKTNYVIADEMGIAFGSVDVLLTKAREDLYYAVINSRMAFSENNLAYIDSYFLS